MAHSRWGRYVRLKVRPFTVSVALQLLLLGSPHCVDAKPVETLSAFGNVGPSANSERNSPPRVPVILAQAQVFPTAKPRGIWQTIVTKIADEIADTVLYSLAVFILLLVVGFWSPRILTFINSTYKKWLEPTNFNLWTARRGGVLYLRRARRALRKNRSPKALLAFANGVDILKAALTDADNRHVDSSPIQHLLDERDLAPLYSLLAWTGVWDKDTKFKAAIDSAEQALRLDPDLVDARIARGWGKLRRNLSGDLSKAESDFQAVIRVGKERGVRFTNAHFGYAETLRLQGEYPQAIDEYTALILDDPKLPGAWAGRGAVYQALGEWQKAADDLTAAVVLQPDHPWAGTFLADSLRLLGRLDEAIENCNKMIEREPDNQLAYYIHGLALYQQSQVQPPPPAPQKQKLLEAAGKQLRAAKNIAAKHQPIADILYRLAAVASDLGNKEESQQWLKQARDSSVSSGVQTGPRVRDVLALWPPVRDLFEKRTADNVAKTLDEAIELIKAKPDDAGTRYSAGLLHLMLAEDAADPGKRSDNIDEAVLHFDKAVQPAPTWAAPYYWRALAHAWRGDLTRARQDCDQAIGADPNLSDAYWLRTKIRNAIDYCDNAVDDVDTALRLMNEAIDRGERDSARYAIRSELHLQRGNLELAVEDAKAAIGLNETNATAHLVFSQALVKLEKFEQALFEADRAAKVNPANADAHMARGLGYYYTGKPQTAVEAFTKVIELRSTESFAYLNRGWARVLLWDKTKSQTDLHLADQDFATAANQAKSAASAYSGQAWVRYWQHQEGAGTLDEAVSFSRRALERDSKLGFTHFVHGWIMIAKGQYAEAKNEFGAAIGLACDIPDAYYGLAEAERVLGNQDAAIQVYTRAIEKAAASSTNVWHAHHGRALAHAGILNWERAFDDYQAALKSAKTSSITLSQYAGLYADFGWTCYELERPDEMESAFARGLELDRKLIHLQLQIGGVRLYSGRYDDALACWSSAISLDPESSIGYVNRGLTYVYRQDIPAALLDLDMALSRDGKDSFAWHTRGWAWVRHGEWKKAVADLDKAIELRSDEPFRFNERALAQWWLRERSHALEDLRKVFDMQLSKLAGKFLTRVREDGVTWGASSEDWTRAVALKPKDFLPHLGRGICRWMAGDLEAARDDLTKARSINARSLDVQAVLERVTEELAARTSIP